MEVEVKAEVEVEAEGLLLLSLSSVVDDVAASSFAASLPAAVALFAPSEAADDEEAPIIRRDKYEPARRANIEEEERMWKK